MQECTFLLGSSTQMVYRTLLELIKELIIFIKKNKSILQHLLINTCQIVNLVMSLLMCSIEKYKHDILEILQKSLHLLSNEISLRLQLKILKFLNKMEVGDQDQVQCHLLMKNFNNLMLHLGAETEVTLIQGVLKELSAKRRLSSVI